MDHKKFEQLITLITNENTEQARALFHDIVVEKSREIYESMMDEEEGMGGQIGGLMDEISADEQGMNEEDEELSDLESGEEDMGDEMELDGDEDFSSDDMDEENAEAGDIEDRVVDLEDKLDELMAEFEELMASESGEEEHAGDFGDEGAEDMGGEEDFGDEGAEDMGGEEEQGAEEMMESTTLQPVKGLYGSKIGGDDGVQTKSPALTKPKVVATGAKPVSFSQGDEKGRSVPAPKTIPGTYKNAAGQKKQDLETAPKPTTTQASGVNNKSPMAESRKRK